MAGRPRYLTTSQPECARRFRPRSLPRGSPGAGPTPRAGSRRTAPRGAPSAEQVAGGWVVRHPQRDPQARTSRPPARRSRSTPTTGGGRDASTRSRSRPRRTPGNAGPPCEGVAEMSSSLQRVGSTPRTRDAAHVVPLAEKRLDALGVAAHSVGPAPFRGVRHAQQQQAHRSCEIVPPFFFIQRSRRDQQARGRSVRGRYDLQNTSQSVRRRAVSGAASSDAAAACSSAVATGSPPRSSRPDLSREPGRPPAPSPPRPRPRRGPAGGGGSGRRSDHRDGPAGHHHGVGEQRDRGGGEAAVVVHAATTADKVSPGAQRAPAAGPSERAGVPPLRGGRRAGGWWWLGGRAAAAEAARRWRRRGSGTSGAAAAPRGGSGVSRPLLRRSQLRQSGTGTWGPAHRAACGRWGPAGAAGVDPAVVPLPEALQPPRVHGRVRRRVAVRPDQVQLRHASRAR